MNVKLVKQSCQKVFTGRLTKQIHIAWHVDCRKKFNLLYFHIFFVEQWREGLEERGNKCFEQERREIGKICGGNVAFLSQE